MKKHTITCNKGDLYVTTRYMYKIENVYWKTEINGEEFLVTDVEEGTPMIVEGVFANQTIKDDSAKQIIEDINSLIEGQAIVIGPYWHKKGYCLPSPVMEWVNNTFVLVKTGPDKLYMHDLENILKQNGMLALMPDRATEQ